MNTELIWGRRLSDTCQKLCAVFLTKKCGLRLGRDFNAAINILRVGCSEVKPVEMKAPAAGNSSETGVCEAGNTHKQVTGDKGTHYNFL